MSSHPPPRVPPLPADEWGDAEYTAFGALLGIPGDRVPRAGSGHRFDPMNFSVVGTLVRHPALTEAFLKFNGFLLQRGDLPTRLRELAILRVAHQRQSAYEWAQHVREAVGAGITDAEIEQLVRGNGGFEAADLAVLQATDELLAHSRLSDETWDRLHGLFELRQVTELLFVVGTYAMLAMVFESWRLPPEPGMAALPPLTS